ncbi:hypothetical protein [Rossellomorea sp. LjRoot5]|uniref:hypothetical protein n=1 Tax=Rossellomorea sp. LjRoot5 TaxID=3342331 RepID=UPI003ECCD1A4
MIIINQPKLVKSKSGTRLQAEIDIDVKRKYLWYELENMFQHFLTNERADAFLVALICLRTLLTLDLLGKLNSYNSIFNMQNYFNERKKLYCPSY